MSTANNPLRNTKGAMIPITSMVSEQKQQQRQSKHMEIAQARKVIQDVIDKGQYVHHDYVSPINVHATTTTTTSAISPTSHNRSRISKHIPIVAPEQLHPNFMAIDRARRTVQDVIDKQQQHCIVSQQPVTVVSLPAVSSSSSSSISDIRQPQHSSSSVLAVSTIHDISKNNSYDIASDTSITTTTDHTEGSCSNSGKSGSYPSTRDDTNTNYDQTNSLVDTLVDTIVHDNPSINPTEVVVSIDHSDDNKPTSDPISTIPSVLSTTISPPFCSKTNISFKEQQSMVSEQQDHMEGSILPTKMTNSIHDNISTIETLSKSTTSIDISVNSTELLHAQNVVSDVIDTMTRKIDIPSKNNEKTSDEAEIESQSIPQTDITVETNVYETPVVVDDLVSYLSNRMLLQQLSKISDTVRDPPTASASHDTYDDTIKIDPPLHITISEETRNVNEVEINPNKTLYSIVDDNDDIPISPVTSLVDPEIMKPTIYDEIGEPNPSFQILSSSIDDTYITNIGDDDHLNGLHILTSTTSNTSYVHKEKTVETPKRKVTTILAMPNTKVNGSSNNSTDPDGIYPASTTRDFAIATRNLYVLLLGNIDDNDTVSGFEYETQQFRKLLRYTSKFIHYTDIPTYGISDIMNYANELQIPIVLVDRYLDAIKSMHCDNTTMYEMYDEVENETLLISFLQDLCAHLELLSNQSVDIDVPEITENALYIHTDEQIQVMPLDGIEVEINNGFISKEYRSTDDDEPWWEVAARLNGKLCSKCVPQPATKNMITSDTSLTIDQEHTQSMSYSASTGPSDKSNRTLEKDITTFWNDIEDARLRNRNDVKSSNKSYGGIRKCASDSPYNERQNYNDTIRKCHSYKNESTFLSQRRSQKDIQRKWSSRQAIVESERSFIKRVPSISAVSATSELFGKENTFRDRFPLSMVWRQSYNDRTINHEGYFDVDKYSLYSSSTVQTYRHTLDDLPWESRTVKQRFMYEQSISYTRNWFGCITEIYGNQRIKEPVCRPKSMEMPIDAEEWTEEWYNKNTNHGQPNHSGQHDDADYEDESWEADVPECGKIKNIRLRPNDQRITRVTPDLTCYIRRSRWRKKYLPRGTFPYL